MSVAGVAEGEARIAIRERIMKSGLDALVELNKQVAGQEGRADQAQDAARETNDRHHPFDWWDFLLLMTPIATVVLTMWWDAPW